MNWSMGPCRPWMQWLQWIARQHAGEWRRAKFPAKLPAVQHWWVSGGAHSSRMA